jgi:tRNA 2-thiouridine synthesizing protein E
MTTSTPTKIPVQRDALGYIVHPEQWTERTAEQLARENGIEVLTARQWHVITSMRRAWVENGSAPWIRMMSRISGISITELYRLFPRGPSRLVAKIAGIPKQRACI